MILHREGFCTRDTKGKVHHYFYYEVESVGRVNTDNTDRQFKFVLNFYAKEYGAKNKVLKFTCEEGKEIEDLEESKDEGVKKAETKEFAFIHIFERMLPVYWQKFFEENLKIEGLSDVDGIPIEDCYQYHAFVLKKNSYFMMQRRFMVLT